MRLERPTVLDCARVKTASKPTRKPAQKCEVSEALFVAREIRSHPDDRSASHDFSLTRWLVDAVQRSIESDPTAGRPTGVALDVPGRLVL